MSKRGKLLVTIACLAAIGAVVASRGHESKYKDRSLSEWLAIATATQDARLQSEAVAAVREIGTNAIPLLLRHIAYEPSRNKPRTPGREDQADLAAFAFALLGPIASPAVPELTRLALGSLREDRAERCISALFDIGPDGVPALLALATNAQTKWREPAIRCLGRTPGTNALAAVPVLMALLEDRNDTVASRAAEALGRIRQCPDAVVPALAVQLGNPSEVRRWGAVVGLGLFGPAAVSTTHQLQSLTTNQPPLVSKAAVAALRYIAHDVLTNAPSR